MVRKDTGTRPTEVVLSMQEDRVLLARLPSQAVAETQDGMQGLWVCEAPLLACRVRDDAAPSERVGEVLPDQHLADHQRHAADHIVPQRHRLCPLRRLEALQAKDREDNVSGIGDRVHASVHREGGPGKRHTRVDQRHRAGRVLQAARGEGPCSQRGQF